MHWTGATSASESQCLHFLPYDSLRSDCTNIKYSTPSPLQTEGIPNTNFYIMDWNFVLKTRISRLREISTGDLVCCHEVAEYTSHRTYCVMWLQKTRKFDSVWWDLRFNNSFAFLTICCDIPVSCPRCWRDLRGSYLRPSPTGLSSNFSFVNTRKYILVSFT
jgi:hypothetical protein